MIITTTGSLGHLKADSKNFGGVLGNLDNLSFVKPDTTETASDTLAEEDADFLKYDGVMERVCLLLKAPTEIVLRICIYKANTNQVQEWLKKWVKNPDDVLSTGLDDGSVLANIIETAAGKIDSGLESPVQPCG